MLFAPNGLLLGVQYGVLKVVGVRPTGKACLQHPVPHSAVVVNDVMDLKTTVYTSMLWQAGPPKILLLGPRI